MGGFDPPSSVAKGWTLGWRSPDKKAERSAEFVLPRPVPDGNGSPPDPLANALGPASPLPPLRPTGLANRSRRPLPPDRFVSNRKATQVRRLDGPPCWPSGRVRRVATIGAWDGRNPHWYYCRWHNGAKVCPPEVPNLYQLPRFFRELESVFYPRYGNTKSTPPLDVFRPPPLVLEPPAQDQAPRTSG